MMENKRLDASPFVITQLEEALEERQHNDRRKDNEGLDPNSGQDRRKDDRRTISPNKTTKH